MKRQVPMSDARGVVPRHADTSTQQRLQIAVRSFGDLCGLIEYLTKVGAGLDESVPVFKTREARYLYEVLIAPGLGLKTAGGPPPDHTRLAVDLSALLSLPSPEATGGGDFDASTGAVKAIRRTQMVQGYVEAYIGGRLHPHAPQYAALNHLYHLNRQK